MTEPEGTWPGWTRQCSNFAPRGRQPYPGRRQQVHRLNNTPPWSGRLWVDWTRAIGAANPRCRLRADVTRENDGVFHSRSTTRVQRQSAVGVAGTSAPSSARHISRWFVATFARNLTNEDYITGSRVGTPSAGHRRPPR